MQSPRWSGPVTRQRSGDRRSCALRLAADLEQGPAERRGAGACGNDEGAALPGDLDAELEVATGRRCRGQHEAELPPRRERSAHPCLSLLAHGQDLDGAGLVVVEDDRAEPLGDGRALGGCGSNGRSLERDRRARRKSKGCRTAWCGLQRNGRARGETGERSRRLLGCGTGGCSSSKRGHAQGGAGLADRWCALNCRAVLGWCGRTSRRVADGVAAGEVPVARLSGGAESGEVAA